MNNTNPKVPSAPNNHFFTLLVCLCAFQLYFKRLCSLGSQPPAATMDIEELRLRKRELEKMDIEELRLRKRKLEKKLDLEMKKARRLEAEIELLERFKKVFEDVNEGGEKTKKETNVKENTKKEKH